MLKSRIFSISTLGLCRSSALRVLCLCVVLPFSFQPHSVRFSVYFFYGKSAAKAVEKPLGAFIGVVLSDKRSVFFSEPLLLYVPEFDTQRPGPRLYRASAPAIESHCAERALAGVMFKDYAVFFLRETL